MSASHAASAPRSFAICTAFVVAQGLDLWTTQVILAHGGSEANPFMRMFGDMWPLAKLCLVAIALAYLPKLRPRWAMFFLGLTSVPVINNVIQLLIEGLVP